MATFDIVPPRRVEKPQSASNSFGVLDRTMDRHRLKAKMPPTEAEAGKERNLGGAMGHIRSKRAGLLCWKLGGSPLGLALVSLTGLGAKECLSTW